MVIRSMLRPKACWTNSAVVVWMVTACAIQQTVANPTYAYPGRGGYGYEFSAEQLRLKWLGTERVPDAGRWRIADCSTDRYTCLSADQWMFAIPRGDLKVGQWFQAGSHSVRNLGCVAKNSFECKTFAFQASDTDGKARPSTDGAEKPKSIVYIYDLDRGILAFEDSTEWPEQFSVESWNIDSIGTTTAMYALLGKQGLLAREGNLEKSR